MGHKKQQISSLHVIDPLGEESGEKGEAEGEKKGDDCGPRRRVAHDWFFVNDHSLFSLLFFAWRACTYPTPSPPPTPLPLPHE